MFFWKIFLKVPLTMLLAIIIFQQNGKFLAKNNHLDDNILQGEKKEKIIIIGKQIQKGKNAKKKEKKEG